MSQQHWSGTQVTPFERHRVNNPEAGEEAVLTIKRGGVHNLSPLEELTLVESWAGMIDVTPDLVPVMDEVPDIPGLYLGTGFSGHGFGFGPGAGETLAKLILGSPHKHDLTRFRFGRFYDGSPIEPGPGL